LNSSKLDTSLKKIPKKLQFMRLVEKTIFPDIEDSAHLGLM